MVGRGFAPTRAEVAGAAVIAGFAVGAAPDYASPEVGPILPPAKSAESFPHTLNRSVFGEGDSVVFSRMLQSTETPTPSVSVQQTETSPSPSSSSANTSSNPTVAERISTISKECPRHLLVAPPGHLRRRSKYGSLIVRPGQHNVFVLKLKPHVKNCPGTGTTEGRKKVIFKFKYDKKHKQYKFIDRAEGDNKLHLAAANFDPPETH